MSCDICAYENIHLKQVFIIPWTINGYFIGYAENFKGYTFCCPSHTTRFVESRNVEFLEKDLVIGSDRTQVTFSKNDHLDIQTSTPSEKLIIIHSAPQTVVIQPIIETLII